MKILKLVKKYIDCRTIYDIKGSLKESLNTQFTLNRDYSFDEGWGTYFFALASKLKTKNSYNIRIGVTDENLWTKYTNYIPTFGTYSFLKENKDFILCSIYALQQSNHELLDKVKLYLKNNYDININKVYLNSDVKRKSEYKNERKYFYAACDYLKNYLEKSKSDEELYEKLEDMIWERIMLNMINEHKLYGDSDD